MYIGFVSRFKTVIAIYNNLYQLLFNITFSQKMSTLALEMMLRFYLALLKTATSMVIWKKIQH